MIMIMNVNVIIITFSKKWKFPIDDDHSIKKWNFIEYPCSTITFNFAINYKLLWLTTISNSKILKKFKNTPKNRTNYCFSIMDSSSMPPPFSHITLEEVFYSETIVFKIFSNRWISTIPSLLQWQTQWRLVHSKSKWKRWLIQVNR